MPIIRTTLLRGFTTQEQQAELISALAETMVSVLGEITRNQIMSLVEEVEPGAWQTQGMILTEDIIAAGRAVSLEQTAKRLTPKRVQAAYDALATGDRAQIEEYFDTNMEWLVPGESRVSGLKKGLDEFMEFMALVGELSGGSFYMERSNILINGDVSIDLTHNTGTRAGDTSRKLDIDVAHLMRWSDGKVVEARGAIFGTGTTEFNEFWA